MAAHNKPNTETRLATIDERLSWITKVGWWIAGGLAAAFLALVTWWIPKELATFHGLVKSDTSAQLEPIKIQMATVLALLQLRQTSSMPEAIQRGVDFSQPRSAFAAIKAVADQAKADRIATKPEYLAQLNSRIKVSLSTNSSLIDEAWRAQLALVDYRSSLLHEPDLHTTSSSASSLPMSPMPASPLWRVVNQSHFSSGHHKMDGTYWKNVTFENEDIEYDGGPVAFEKVLFINCTFHMRYTNRAVELADKVLAQDAVTGDLS